MIQRIQTVHLLIAAALVGLFLGLGDAWLSGLASRLPWLPIAVYALAGLTTASALTAILFYKNRVTQARVVQAARLSDLALVAVLAIALSLTAFGDGATAADLAASSVTLLPIFAYVFLLLAGLGVRRDIELVRSMDRLR